MSMSKYLFGEVEVHKQCYSEYHCKHNTGTQSHTYNVYVHLCFITNTALSLSLSLSLSPSLSPPALFALSSVLSLSSPPSLPYAYTLCNNIMTNNTHTTLFQTAWECKHHTIQWPYKIFTSFPL